MTKKFILASILSTVLNFGLFSQTAMDKIDEAINSLTKEELANSLINDHQSHIKFILQRLDGAKYYDVLLSELFRIGDKMHEHIVIKRSYDAEEGVYYPAYEYNEQLTEDARILLENKCFATNINLKDLKLLYEKFKNVDDYSYDGYSIMETVYNSINFKNPEIAEYLKRQFINRELSGRIIKWVDKEHEAVPFFLPDLVNMLTLEEVDDAFKKRVPDSWGSTIDITTYICQFGGEKNEIIRNRIKQYVLWEEDYRNYHARKAAFAREIICNAMSPNEFIAYAAIKSGGAQEIIPNISFKTPEMAYAAVKILTGIPHYNQTTGRHYPIELEIEKIKDKNLYQYLNADFFDKWLPVFETVDYWSTSKFVWSFIDGKEVEATKEKRKFLYGIANIKDDKVFDVLVKHLKTGGDFLALVNRPDSITNEFSGISTKEFLSEINVKRINQLMDKLTEMDAEIIKKYYAYFAVETDLGAKQVYRMILNNEKLEASKKVKIPEDVMKAVGERFWTEKEERFHYNESLSYRKIGIEPVYEEYKKLFVAYKKE